MRDEFNVIMENVSSMMQYNKDECDRMYRLMKVTEERKNFDRKVKALSGFKSHNVNIVVLNDNVEDKSPQEELMDDLMSIIASFSVKLYGLRSGKSKLVENKIEDVLKESL